MCSFCIFSLEFCIGRYTDAENRFYSRQLELKDLLQHIRWFTELLRWLNKNLWEEIQEAILKSTLQTHASKRAASPVMIQKLLIKSGALVMYIHTGLPQFTLLNQLHYWLEDGIIVLQLGNRMCKIRKLTLQLQGLISCHLSYC